MGGVVHKVQLKVRRIIAPFFMALDHPNANGLSLAVDRAGQPQYSSQIGSVVDLPPPSRGDGLKRPLKASYQVLGLVTFFFAIDR